MANDLVILNIGLSAPSFMKAKPLSHVERLAILRKQLPGFLNVSRFTCEVVPRHIYGGEPMVVVAGVFCEQWQSPLFEMLTEMEQDCCAIYNPATGKGELFGAYAGRWGEFNRGYFVL